MELCLELRRVSVLKYPASRLPHTQTYDHSAPLSRGGCVLFFFLFTSCDEGGGLVTPHKIDVSAIEQDWQVIKPAERRGKT